MIHEREKSNTNYEIIWKNDIIKGQPKMKGKAELNTVKLLEMADAIWNIHTQPEEQSKQFQNPQKHPSILVNLWLSGERKIQRLLSRLDDMERAKQFLQQPRTDTNQARLRGVLNPMANIPLRVTPSHDDRRFTNAEFEWFLCNRLRQQQPSVAEIHLQTCKCGIHIGDGRHFRRCVTSNNMMRIHDTLRETSIDMFRSAGLHVLREPANLLRDSDNERPADVYIKNWSINKSPYRNHAIDLSFPLVESQIKYHSKEFKCLVCSQTGVVANKKAEDKSKKVGSQKDQQVRGNNNTMQQRCNLEGINYWPVPVEGDGQTSAEFEALLKHVSDAAFILRQHNPSSFRRKWKTNFACKLAKKSAQVALTRAVSEYKRITSKNDSADDIALESQMEVPDLVGHNRSYRNQFSRTYIRFLRKN